MKAAVLAAVLVMASVVAGAATLTVTKTTDDPVDGCDADCSLREAVIAANATVEHDTIVVPAGTYGLTLFGAGEDGALTGDLDFNENATVVGDPLGGTVIDGMLSDRLVHLRAGTLELVDLVLTRGRTVGDTFGAGGVLVQFGTLTMTRCVVSDCSCDATGGGVFIYSLSTVTIDRSAIVGNTGASGGGVFHAGDNLVVVNSTISGNTATVQYSGGITVDDWAYLTSIESSTITGNTGPESSAASFWNIASISNTIFDGTCAFVSPFGSLQSEGGNLESPGDTCTLVHPSDQVGVSAAALALGPLQNNGGVTPTHGLLDGSAAIDTGSNAYCPDADQRGWQRWDPTCDIGAFEVGAIGPPIFDDGFEDGTTGAWSATTP
jgi:CSLREA domain-containing protein